MKASELREMNDEQLQATLKETIDQFFRLRIQAQTERLDAPSELRRNRKLVARIKTEQTVRSKASSTDETPPPVEVVENTEETES
jgi:large subunit ribosomal protein L29